VNANTRAVLRAIGASLVFGWGCAALTLLASGMGPGTVLAGVSGFGLALWMHGLPRSGP